MKLEDRSTLTKVTEWDEGGSYLEVSKEVELGEVRKPLRILVREEGDEYATGEVDLEVEVEEESGPTFPDGIENLSESLSLLDDCYSLLQEVNQKIEVGRPILTSFQRAEVKRLMDQVGYFLFQVDVGKIEREEEDATDWDSPVIWTKEDIERLGIALNRKDMEG